jgi:hypothetical protein
MPKSWFVACHAGIYHETSKGTIRHLFPRASVFTVPPKMKVVFYCPGDKQLTMVGGWKLWDMLMYGEHGGEQAAYAARHKEFTGGSTVSNYKCFRVSDDPDWDDGMVNRANGHPIKNTYGIWEVGNTTAPALAVTASGMLLSDIVGNAVFSGVAQVYFGACRVHWKSSTGAMTSKSNTLFTPPGL